MDKARKKELLKDYKAKEKQSFLESLPTDEDVFWELFDYLDEYLEEQDGCNHSLSLTRAFLETKGVEVERILEWIVDNGGGCDCEVLYNVEERFEEYC